MSRRLSGLADRVRRLTDALAGLRERVRAAVAAELGSAVGAAVRDLVHTLAHGGDVLTDPYARSRDAGRDWDDDPWGDGRSPPPSDRWDNDVGPAGDEVAATPQHVTRLAGAVAAAAAVARWWAANPVIPPWAAAALTVLAGAAAWCGGPLAHAALAAVAAAADLAAVGRLAPTPIP